MPRSLAAALLSAALLVAGCIKTETVYDVRDPLPAATIPMQPSCASVATAGSMPS